MGRGINDSDYKVGPEGVHGMQSACYRCPDFRDEAEFVLQWDKPMSVGVPQFLGRGWGWVGELICIKSTGPISNTCTFNQD